MQQATHRSSLLKQQNKGHKTGRHRSKGSVSATNRGRIGLKALTGGSKKGSGWNVQRRTDRKHQQSQSREQKKAAILAQKRSVGSVGAPPICVAVVALGHAHVDDRPDEALLDVLSATGDVVATKSGLGALHVAVQRFKQRFAFLTVPASLTHAVLDVTKACDSVVFLVSALEAEDLSVEAERVIASVLAQGLPSEPVFVITDLDQIPPKKQGDAKKILLKTLNKRFPVEKVFTCKSDQEGLLLIRHMGAQKRLRNNLRDRRAHLLAEEAEFTSDGMLKVTGYVRSKALSVNRLVHIPGVGSFQLDRLEAASDPHPVDARKKGGKGDSEMADVEQSLVLARADPSLQESLVAENEPDMFDGEQALSAEEEAIASTAITEEKKVVKVPRGTSAYQAAWIVEDEDDEGEEDDDEDDDEDEEDEVMNDAASQEDSEGEEEEKDDQDYETMTVASEANFDNYDEKHVNFAEEEEELKKLKAARIDQMFPDEVDTPVDQLARVRFQKYRGLGSFRTSPWDPKENLPQDYSRIFQFESFDRTRKRVLGEEVEGVEPGTYVSMYIRDVPQHMMAEFLSNAEPKPRPLVVYSMLPHENKMSVLNIVVKRHMLGHQDPIRSKERLIFHCGFRRFSASPVFSQHTNGSKHKFERFWRSDNSTVVMTLFAPIMYPPCSILVYQEVHGGRHDLVGTGSLLSADPDRLVIKRSILSGHPFKVHKRTSTVRFMFFNREDIDWFKPIELRTKQGRRGHIKMALGTHGHMKVAFDGQISQQDTVLLNLFKRVFPKWNYDPFVPEPAVASSELEQAEGGETLQLFRKPRKEADLMDM